MKEYFLMIAALPVAVIVLSLFLWPLRMIVQSEKAKGLSKMAWFLVWLFAFSFGSFEAASLVLVLGPNYGGEHTAEIAAITVAPLPGWLVYFCFKRWEQAGAAQAAFD